MYHKVVGAEYESDYRLLLTFDNGEKKIVNLAPYIVNGKRLFKQLSDLNYFKSFRLTSESIEWPNGADICPNLLYEIGTKVAKIA